jgi:lipopolysaccharide biosynthesis glycosyltransferase
MFVSSEVNVVVSIDKKFYQHLFVLINSAKYHTTKKICLYLCVADVGTKVFFEEKLLKCISCNFSYEIIIFRDTKFVNIFKDRVFDHPIECYFRLLFGDLLPEHLHKIIYLDADMIVNSDLVELFEYPLSTSIG